MDTNTLLYIAFIIYIMTMIIATVFKIRWLYMLAGIIWFIPMSEIDNLWITIISIVLIIVHFMLGMTGEKEDF